jgi:hypothetical protein
LKFKVGFLAVNCRFAFLQRWRVPVNLYIPSLALNALIQRGTLMSRIDWILLVAFIVGFLLFLYGANTYNAIVGYGGIYLFIGSIAAYLIIYIYHELTKKKTC